MSRRPSRMTHQASPKRSKRYGLRRDCRPTIAIRSSIAGGTSKNRCSPTAGTSRQMVKHTTMRRSWNVPRRYGSCVGASSRSPPMYRVAPQKSSFILPPEGQGERCRKKRCAPHGIGQAGMDIALGTPQETHQSLSGGKADDCRAGKRG